jgi:hypothetical protein
VSEPERGSSFNNDEKPIFVKITIRPTRKLEDMKVGEVLYYMFFDFKNECVVIRAGKFKSAAGASGNKTSIRIDKFNLFIEV